MADGDIQGLLVRIEATTAQLRQEMARGESAVATAAGKIDGNLGRIDGAFDRTEQNATSLQAAISRAFTGASVASAAAVAGLVAITNRTTEYAQEVKNLAALSNTSVDDFQRLAAGAKTVGIEQDKLSDIYKDMNDRVGEFIARGGGEMADFFNEIAPQVGVTADMFAKLSGPQALQLYYSSLEKAGLSQQSMTTYMEAVADEATGLIPLLRNNGQGFREFGEQAEKAGRVLSQLEIDRLVEVRQSIVNLQGAFDGASRQLVTGMLPGMEGLADLFDRLSGGGAAEALGQAIGFLAENVNILVAAVGVKASASFLAYSQQVLASTKATLGEALGAKGAAAAKLAQAEASATAAAAYATEMSARTANARSTEAEAIAKVRSLQASREQLAYSAALAKGTSEEARFTATLTALDLELAAAKKAAAAASRQLGGALAGESVAMAKDAAATRSATAAKEAYAKVSSLAARAGSGLLGILGGPAGIASLAIGAGIAFLTMRDSTDDATQSMLDMQQPLDKVAEKFKQLTRDQQAAEQVATSKKQVEAIREQAAAYQEFLDLLRQQFGSDMFLRLKSDIDAAYESGVPLVDVIADLQTRFRIPKDVSDSWIEQAGKVSTAAEKTAFLTQVLNTLTGALQQNTTATNENNAAKGGMSATENTYLEALQKRNAALEDGNSETKKATRWLSEQKNVTEEGRKAILEEAAAADRQRKAKDAATKAAQAASSASKEAATETKNQAEALADLQTQSKIAVESAQGLAAAYLAGTDKSREFGVQQKAEQAMLRAGAGARKEIEAAIRGQADAEDRLSVAKSAFDLAEETEQLLAQARATLQGAAALEAYNLQKAMQVALVGKNIAAGSKEYDQLLAATKAQQAAVKVAKQAADAGSIMDRLYPEKKLLREYTEGQEALNKAMELAPEKTSEYQDALRLLGLEYEQNRSAATAWGKFTEGAVDRVDDAFANAWKNIGNGFDGFATNLKEGFKQLLAELAHMAITRPIVMQIGAALGVGGLSAQTSGIFGGSASGSGMSLSSLWNMGSSAYSAITSGFGGAIAAGWNAGQGFLGGMQGAISGGYGYISSAVSSLFGGGATAAGASNVGFGLGQSLVSGGVGSSGAAAGSGASYATGAGGATALGGALAGIGGALYGYGKSGVKGAATGAAGGVGGYYAGAALGSLAGPLGTVIGGVIGSALGSFVGGSLFGGSWQTKDVGLSLGVTGGEFVGQQYEYQKKKGGLFGKNKKRTRYSALDPEMQAVMQETYDATEGAVVDLFDRIGVSVGEGAFAGLTIAKQQISTKGKTEEEIQTAIAEMFGGFADQMVSYIDQGVGGYKFAELAERVAVFESFNKSLGLIDVAMLNLSPHSMELANAMMAAAGGLEAYTSNLNTYFNSFFSEAERADKTLASVQQQFKDMNVVLPETREGYRKVIEALDLTTESGQQMYLTLIGAAGAAAQAYDILEAKALQASQAAQQAASEVANGLLASVNSAFSAVQRAVNAQKTALTDSYNAQIASLNDMSQTAQKSVSDLAAVGSSLGRALKALRGDSDEAVKVLRAQALATLNSALATVQAGRSLAGISGLDDALEVLSQNNMDAYSSLEAYNRDQGLTANIVSQLEAVNGKQLSAAEKTVSSLQTRVEQAKKAYDLQISQYDAQLTLAQAQIDALNGLDNSVISVAAAVNGLSQAVTAALSVADDGAARQNTYDNNVAIVRAVYRTVLGRDAEAKGLADWAGALTGGLLTYDELMASIAQQGRLNGENVLVPGFASGGMFSGGLRLVGERGPELEVTGPSRIYNANQTAAMLNGGQGDVTAAEVRELRVELKSALFAIAKNTQKAAKNTDLLPQKLEQELFREDH
ncbi:hypothetical protein [Pseudomonas kurunegalensis]|uniref:hypothetical protein n=1 Tax=Pseudomonas kurunegalensis TaxID=485880 RepID=UPI00289478F8|nr:hypothetical protein [Pseudomonas kurunegalensis]MDT3749740.1 hypothetical protein [Pseudomonas kurunegalensis]